MRATHCNEPHQLSCVKKFDWRIFSSLTCCILSMSVIKEMKFSHLYFCYKHFSFLIMYIYGFYLEFGCYEWNFYWNCWLSDFEISPVLFFPSLHSLRCAQGAAGSVPSRFLAFVGVLWFVMSDLMMTTVDGMMATSFTLCEEWKEVEQHSFTLTLIL